jgi:glycosyltransferase involved in cell wall biosynthesis
MKVKGRWPKISIVTPSYNQAQFLERTICSILDQGYPNLEYIVMDGGSTDGSQKIIKKYQKKLHYWTSKKDRGQADAINKGFRKTSGEIMGWLNSDDVLLPGSLFLIASIFSELEDVHWVSGTPHTVTEDGFTYHLGLKPVYVQSLLRAGWYHGRSLGFVMQEGSFWRRSLWKKVGGKLPDLFYGMDFKLWQKFAEKTPLVPVHVPLAGFRLNSQRKSIALDKYYQEIGVKLPELTKLLGRGVRTLLQIPRALRLTQQICFELEQKKFVYYPSFFDRVLRKKQPQAFQLKTSPKKR